MSTPRISIRDQFVIAAVLSAPGVRHTWDNSPLGKSFLDESFVAFVDDVIKRDIDKGQ